MEDRTGFLLKKEEGKFSFYSSFSLRHILNCLILEGSIRCKSMVRYSTLLFTLLLFLAALSEAQYSDSSAHRFDKAIQLTHDQLYQLAIPVWEKLHEAHPEHSGINFYTGLTYFNSQKQKLKAISYLERALDSIAKDHEPFLKDRSAPPDAHYYLGRAYHLAYRFDDAIERYRSFKEQASKELKDRYRVERRIERAKRAKKMVQDPVPVTIENLGPEVNSEYLDHSPVPSSKEDLLFFTSRRLRKDSANYKVREWGTGKHFEQIYVAEQNSEGGWKEARPLRLFKEYEGSPSAVSEALRPGYSKFNHTATSMITNEDGELIVYRSSGQKGNLYRSERKKNGKDGEWGRPEKMENAINSASFQNHLSISGNEQQLFFVSTRKGGHGGKDIYGMRKLPNGEWSDIYNLGPKINTPMDEDGPVVHPNGELLYFSSQGHESMGGFDIFVSRIQDNGSWSEPRNIGYPINTPDDDIYFMASADGKDAYYSVDYKNVKRNVAAVPGYGEEDLYRVRFPGNTEEPLAYLEGHIEAGDACEKGKLFDILALNENGDTLRHLRPSVGAGNYSFQLPAGKNYRFLYLFKGKELREDDLKLPAPSAYRKLQRSLVLDTLRLVANGQGCTLKGPEADPVAAVEEARKRPPGPTGLFEVTAQRASEDKEQEEPQAPRDTVRIVKRDTVWRERSSKKAEGPVKKAANEKLLYRADLGYNNTAPARDDPEWEALTDTLFSRLKAGKSLPLRIEASASKVPTRSYPSNLILAGQRVEALRDALEKVLRAQGYSLKDVTLKDQSIQVQGPEFQGDPGNEERYAPYQYVKVYLVTD